VTTAQPDSRSVDRAHSPGGGFVNSRAFEILSRAGFVARALGHVARTIVFGLVAVFLLEAAHFDGALGKLYNASGGPFLLGVVALGLIAFGCFSLVEARYRRI
jgi:hypothetical protein